MSPLCGALQRVVRAPPLISSGPPVVEGAVISSLIIFIFKSIHTLSILKQKIDCLYFFINERIHEWQRLALVMSFSL